MIFFPNLGLGRTLFCAITCWFSVLTLQNWSFEMFFFPMKAVHYVRVFFSKECFLSIFAALSPPFLGVCLLRGLYGNDIKLSAMERKGQSRPKTRTSKTHIGVFLIISSKNI